MFINLLGMRLCKIASVYKAIKSATQEAIFKDDSFLRCTIIQNQKIVLTEDNALRILKTQMNYKYK